MRYAIIDIESTGGNPLADRIMEVAIFVYDGEEVVEKFESLINPEVEIPPFISRLTGISNKMVANAPTFSQIADIIDAMTRHAVFVAHNVQFDYAYIKAEFKRLNKAFQRPKLCTVKLSRQLLPGKASYSLGKLCRELQIHLEGRHRAAGDAAATVELFKILQQQDIHTGIIKQSINDAQVFNHLPEGLAPETLENLPEEIGVFFFLNAHQEVIFVGKSDDISRRVLQHFSNTGSRALQMTNQVRHVTYEETGNELIAAIIEHLTIQQHRPIFNHNRRTTSFRYGIYASYNEQGYCELEIRKIVPNSPPPVLAFAREDEAHQGLRTRIQQYRLCPKLCNKEQTSGACSLVRTAQCKGACAGQESAMQYNQRIANALGNSLYPHTNFMIFGNGRHWTEKSVICIENSRLWGYGYLENTESYISQDDIKTQLTHLKNTSYELNRLVSSFLSRHQAGKIVPYGLGSQLS